MDLGGAQGLLWAFDSLYVVVNERGTHGLYRVRDTDGDDRSTRSSCSARSRAAASTARTRSSSRPDGKSLYVVCGNATKLTKVDALARPARSGARTTCCPACPTGLHGRRAGAPGWIARTDPDGKQWELVAAGLPQPVRHRLQPRRRAVHLRRRHGVGHQRARGIGPRASATSSAAPSSASATARASGRPTTPTASPAVVDIGPGSPTGITFGYGAKFPAKYQDALFICDWSYGKLYAVHLKPEGASYTAEVEEFLTGTPLPLTDVVINPKDGAMYFAVGGRGTQSGLYRVTYVGGEVGSPSSRPGRRGRGPARPAPQARGLPRPPRRRAVEAAWPYLGPGPVDPLRRPGRDRVAGPGAVARQGPGARPTRARPSPPCWRWPASAARTSPIASRPTRRPTRPCRARSWPPWTAIDWARLSRTRSRRPAARLRPGVHTAWAARRRGVPRAWSRSSTRSSPRRPWRPTSCSPRSSSTSRPRRAAAEDHGGPAGGPDAGGADRLRPGPPRPEDRLDARAAQGVLPLVRHEASAYRGGNSFASSLADDQGPGDRDAERRGDGRR